MAQDDDVRTDGAIMPPRTALIASAVLTPAFVAGSSFVVWLSSRNVEGCFWAAIALVAIVLAPTTGHMIGTKWRLDRVAYFVTTAGTAMGLGWAGMTLYGDKWWAFGAFGLFFVTTLVALFTDLEDEVKLWGLIASMLVPAAIVAGTFSYMISAGTAG